MVPSIEEGFVRFRGHSTWYRTVGECERGRLPLPVLHGGPGMPHDYLQPLEAIAATGRKVVLYDQLGCGRSDHPHDPGLWSVELFLEELEAVRERLGLDRVHLLGQSWGASLVMEHAVAGAAGIGSLTLCDPLADAHHWITEANCLRSMLPLEVQEALTRHEEAGTTSSDEYQKAMMVYYRRHVCRMDPWPEYIERAAGQMFLDPEVYNTMWGPSEFHVTGKLKDWSVLPRLGRIGVPTLLMSGRYDEATPRMMEEVRKRIGGSEWRLFEHSSHMPHAEEEGLFMSTLADFLDRTEVNRIRE
jgi:proline-specific peptidase